MSGPHGSGSGLAAARAALTRGLWITEEKGDGPRPSGMATLCHVAENSRGDRLLRERRACAQRYAHRCRGLALYRHRQQQHAGAMGMEGEDMVRMTALTIMGPP